MSFEPLSQIAHVVDEERRWTRDWYNWLGDLIRDYRAAHQANSTDISALQTAVATLQSDVATGIVTFAAGTTAVGVIDPQPDTNYAVLYDSPEDNYFWTTSKTAANFTANAKISTSATVRWVIVR
jgi:hypothetical protein